MANQAAKKIAQENTRILSVLTYGFIIIHALYWFVRILFYRGITENTELVIYGSSSLLSLFLFAQLRNMGKPKYGERGELLSEGYDLNSPGIVEYMLDTIYVTWLAQIVSLFWSYGWWLLSLVPLYLLFTGAKSFLLPMLLNSSSPAAPYPTSKRAEKKKANEGKVKVKYSR
ncbi:hypothetical protein MP638_004862 [Amoeboaphelidium occidentale]|nr:hypothetical protein MP638_004862 [Amoeboaphelidium occidentale]